MLKEDEKAEEGEIPENITIEEENNINEGENREALETTYIIIENEEKLEVSETDLDKEKLQTSHGDKSSSKKTTP